ncbi:MAG: hypothetical protein VW125_09025 [Flavobacteriaceae bacterium]
MKQSIVFLLLLHINLGILAPSFVLLYSDASEETVALITTEKELDMEEEEFEKTVFFYQQLFDKNSQIPFSNHYYWKPNLYQDVVVSKLNAPPRGLV